MVRTSKRRLMLQIVVQQLIHLLAIINQFKVTRQLQTLLNKISLIVIQQVLRLRPRKKKLPRTIKQ